MVTKRKSNRAGIMVLTVSITFLICVFVFWFQAGLQSLWQKNQRVNVLVFTKPVFVVSYDLKNNSINAVAIPADISLETTKGYGNYRLDKLLRLDDQEKQNGRLLMSSISKLLGIPIDGYIDDQKTLKDISADLDKDQFIKLHYGIIGLNQLFSGIKSNSVNNIYSIIDNLKCYLVNQRIKGGKIGFINLGLTSAYLKINGGDETQFNTLDLQRLDEVLKDYFNEDEISNENYNIEVLNSTSESGLAEDVARLITNIGGKIVNTDNSSEKNYTGCKLFTDEKVKKTTTYRRLKKLFSCRDGEGILNNSRADLSMIIGVNFKK